YFNIYRKPEPRQTPAGSVPASGASDSSSSAKGASDDSHGHVRVLLADDHQALRDGLKSLFEDESDIDVVGEAANGEEAVVMTKRIKPDIVIMDVTMPRMNGIEATRVLRKEFPR